jgi:XTP/dITP diphosphohydrolase
MILRTLLLTTFLAVPALASPETDRWEQRKAAERSTMRRLSCVDGVPTGLPALALAQKVVARVTAAGLPADLIPPALRTVNLDADTDAENDLRNAVLEFADNVRAAEHAVAAGRSRTGARDQRAVTAQEWRLHWR